MQGLFMVENRHGARFVARWEHNQGGWELHLWEEGETIAAWSGCWVVAGLADAFEPVAEDDEEVARAC